LCVPQRVHGGLRRFGGAEDHEAEPARTPLRVEWKIDSNHRLDAGATEHLLHFLDRRLVREIAEIQRAILRAPAILRGVAAGCASAAAFRTARRTSLKWPNGDGATGLHRSVEHLARRTCLVFRRERDEAESARTPSRAIARDADLDHRAARCFEQLTEHG